MPSCLNRVAVVLSVVAVTAAVGCFGGAHNPGYFPSYIPPGDIIQTHAKPPGGGYFRDFDPKATRLEVTPVQVTCKPGGQQVLIATVYDKDGVPRRGRRVEWMLDGPGHIVETDESGWTAGRGYKVNSKYAVGYTNYFEHTFTRGNDDPRDDFTVVPGQAWCVVSSAVPGETVVTAYAPGVFNWDKGRVLARVNWGDNSEFTFPPATSGRIGGEVELGTVIKKVAEREGVNPADLRVRYRVIPGGAPASFAAPAGVSAARAGLDSLDIIATTDGRAPVKVVQMSPRPGRTDVAVEILKPDANGVGEGKVVGKHTTSVEWAAPKLNLDIRAPKVLAPNGEGTLTLVASNPSKVDASAGQVAMRFTGFEAMPEEPPADRRGDGSMLWTLPPMAAGEKRELRFRVRAAGEGPLTAEAVGRTGEGDAAITATTRSTTEVGTPQMKVSVEPSVTASVGERVPVKVVVSNSGSVPLDTATAFVTFSGGLEHDTGSGQAEATVGVVPPGETRTVTVPLIARQTGKQTVRVGVRAGDQRDQKEMTVEVRKPELRLTVAGPKQMSPGTEQTFEVGVLNAGDAAVPNVGVKLAVPAGFTVSRASDGGTIGGAGTVVWRVGDLPPGGSQVLKVAVSADKPAEKAMFAATAASGDPTAADRKAGGVAGLTARAETNVTVQGQPALVLELADPREPVPVGRRGAYRVIVRNKGTGPAKQVQVTVFLPEQYANVRGLDTTRVEVRPEREKLIFPAVKEIPANGTASFYVEVEGATAGDARVRAEVVADYLSKPLVEEQSTRVVERK
jgi:uncharacterized repeat protein (TIGR01451 family)